MLRTPGRFRHSPIHLQAIRADCCSAETDSDIAIHDAVALVSAKLRREMWNTQGSARVRQKRLNRMPLFYRLIVLS